LIYWDILIDVYALTGAVILLIDGEVNDGRGLPEARRIFIEVMDPLHKYRGVNTAGWICAGKVSHGTQPAGSNDICRGGISILAEDSQC
jgi:hypothetical protein